MATFSYDPISSVPASSPQFVNMPMRTRGVFTGGSFDKSSVASTILLGLMLAAPTGINSVYSVAQSAQRLNRIPYYDTTSVEHKLPDINTHFSSIRNVLAVSISELADIFGVSRQAVYKWLSGGPISGANRQRLDDLVEAASILAPYYSDTFQALSKRQNFDGEDLMTTLSRGGTARVWASQVAMIIWEERRQRRSIDQMAFSHRTSGSASRELGIPLLSEQAD